MLVMYDQHIKEMKDAANALSDDFFKQEIIEPFEEYKSVHLEKAKEDLLKTYSEKEIHQVVQFIKTTAGKKFIESSYTDSKYELELEQFMESLISKVMNKLDSGL